MSARTCTTTASLFIAIILFIVDPQAFTYGAMIGGTVSFIGVATYALCRAAR